MFFEDCVHTLHTNHSSIPGEGPGEGRKMFILTERETELINVDNVVRFFVKHPNEDDQFTIIAELNDDRDIKLGIVPNRLKAIEVFNHIINMINDSAESIINMRYILCEVLKG